MPEQWFVFALVLGLFVVVFPTIWCGVVLLLAWIGGWHALAKAYPARIAPHGHAFPSVSGRVGIVSYRHTLSVHVAPEGLFLSTAIFFRIGHPPLLIPWQAIHSQRRVSFLWLQAVAFDVGTPAIANVQLPRDVFDAKG